MSKTITVEECDRIHLQLGDLRNESGENLHKKLTLADQLLSNREWVTDPTRGGGDESRAIDRLEDHAFGDSPMSLPEMLEILHAVPQLSVWRANKFRVRKMHMEMKTRQGAATATATAAKATGAPGASAAPTTLIPTPTPDMEVKRLKQELRQRDEQIRVLTHENRKLRKAVAKLQAAIGELQMV